MRDPVGAMDVLIFGDTVRSHELRHEVPISIPDAFIYAEREGERHVVAVSFEGPRVEELGGYAFHPFDEFGFDELRRAGLSRTDLIDEVVVRAARGLGFAEAVVPASFPVLTADRLRAAGVTLRVDQAVFDDRRRVKSQAELAGIRRAQAAATAGMGVARGLLRRAVPGDGGVLEVDGLPLTSEAVKAAIAAVFVAHGAAAEGFIVSHGAQAAVGHEMGSGELRAGEPIVVDLWPRDGASACFADMTRTFVVGPVPDEVARWHEHCLEALERSRAALGVGVRGVELFDLVCDLFEAAGYATQRTKAEGEMLDHGFFHSLGHGVGLAVHEEPFLAIYGQRPIVAGDVVTLEPGLYRPGVGGVRLEDLVLVTDAGVETLTDFPTALAP